VENPPIAPLFLAPSLPPSLPPSVLLLLLSLSLSLSGAETARYTRVRG